MTVQYIYNLQQKIKIKKKVESNFLLLSEYYYCFVLSLFSPCNKIV